MVRFSDEWVYNQQIALRRSMLDRSGAIQHGAARCLAAELLLYLNEPATCWSISLDWLRSAVGAERVDGSYGSQSEHLYKIGQFESSHSSEDIPSLKGLKVNNHSSLAVSLWQSRTPVVLEQIEQNKQLDPCLRQEFAQRGTKSKMVAVLRNGSQPFAILCADHVSVQSADWQTNQYDLFATTCATVLSPILSTFSPMFAERRAGESDLAKLTKAEAEVARLVARGFSYKEIARELDRSFHTIDHHLRSVRRKLQIASHAKLACHLGGVDKFDPVSGGCELYAASP